MPDHVVHRATVKLFGITVNLEYRLNEAEAQRRQAVGLSAVTQLHVLNVFMGLPAGLPVPSECLSKSDRKVLLRAPKGCVEFTLDGVVRRIVPPLTVVSIVARGRDWHSALVRASRFAPYCVRSALVTREPSAEELMEANFYGVGVLLKERRGVRTLVEPEPFEGYRHTPAGWAFDEAAYGQLPKHGVVALARTQDC